MIAAWVLVHDSEAGEADVVGVWLDEAAALAEARRISAERHADVSRPHTPGVVEARRWVAIHERRYPDGLCGCAPFVIRTTLHP